MQPCAWCHVAKVGPTGSRHRARGVILVSAAPKPTRIRDSLRCITRRRPDRRDRPRRPDRGLRQTVGVASLHSTVSLGFTVHACR
eukprot:3405009-Prymnesium_polylepis.1